MTDHDHDDGPSRRKVLECMTWAGTGVLWTICGGVPHSLGLVDEAMAADAKGLTFLQISDSHMGFDKPANPNAKGTLEEAIGRIKAMPAKPAFMIHTGDITHLSKESRIRRRREDHLAGQARRALRAGRARHHRSRHQALQGALRPRHQGRGLLLASTPTACTSSAWSTSPISRAAAWAASATSSSNGSRTISRAARRRRRSWCSRISRCGRSIRNGAGAPRTARARSATLKRFGSVTVLNGHIHQVMQKVEGNVTFHTARSTAFPQPAPGTAPSPGPMKVPDDKLRTHARHRQRDLQAGRAAARHHRHAAAELSAP